jgi:hypothetical protein
LKNLAAIAATAIVLLILLATSVPLMHWFVSAGRDAELADGEALWSGLSITDYDFTIRKTCVCPPPAGTSIEVSVRDSRLATARSAEGGSRIDLGDIPGTVPALFVTVHEAIADDPDTLEIAYDPDYGFPRTIRIDHRKAYADDEVTYSILSFRPR